MTLRWDAGCGSRDLALGPMRPPARTRKVRCPRAGGALLGLALLVGYPTSAALAQAAPHPFYERLLADGSRSLLGGDHQTAARQLRLAAFGLLDDPVSLVEALVQLSLAQVALQDEPGASESISRVLDAERRFGAYAAAAEGGLSLDVRREFEALLVDRFTEAQLRDQGSLSRLGDTRLERDLAALGLAERRARLVELAAAAPHDPRWSTQLAQMALDDLQLESAIAYATQVLDHDPANAAALCVRGVARAESGQCEGAAVDLAACSRALDEERFVTGRIDCLARLGRLEEATAALAALPPELRAEKGIRRLERSVDDQVAAAAKQAALEQRRLAQANAAAVKEAERLARVSGATATETAAEPPPENPPNAVTTPAPETSPIEGAASEPRLGTQPEGARETRQTSQPPAAGEAATPPTATPPAIPSRGQSGARGNSRPVVETGIPPEGAATAAQIRQKIEKARTTNDFVEPMQLARELADSYPGSRDAQHLAAEVAYRASRWSESVAFFERGGLPGTERPELSFYEAVARYEIGDLAGARVALDRALPHIRRTPFVERYVARIHGSGAGVGAPP